MTLSVTVGSGTGPYSYQWFSQFSSASAYSLLSGAVTDSYVFQTSASTAIGSWTFEVEVTDATGAVVNSTEAPVIVSSSVSATPTLSAYAYDKSFGYSISPQPRSFSLTDMLSDSSAVVVVVIVAVVLG